MEIYSRALNTETMHVAFITWLTQVVGNRYWREKESPREHGNTEKNEIKSTSRTQKKIDSQALWGIWRGSEFIFDIPGKQ